MISSTVSASTSLIVLVPLALRKITERYAQYSDTDANDLRGLCDHYLSHCQNSSLTKVEFDLSNVDNLNANIVSQLESTDNKVPIYLQYNSIQKLPELYIVSHGQFAPCKTVGNWVRNVAKGHLADAIEESLGYICEYQRERDSAVFKREFSYDPINLFFEELKVWLLQLSKVPLNDAALLLNIDNRIRYLNAINADQALFKPQGIARVANVDTAYPVRATLDRLIKILHEKIRPVVEDVLSRQSAREHFDLLRVDIKYAIKQVFQFLYYGLRDNKTSPNFLLEELRKPNFKTYKDNASSILDSVLRHVARLPSVVEVIPTVTAGLENDQLSYGNFILNDGTISLPVLAAPLDHLTITDFWQSSQRNGNTGILSAFRNQECMNVFLKLCGYIERLCLSYAIVDEFFALAGEGGNLLVYRLAASELQPLLAQLNAFFKAVINESQWLYNCVSQHYQSCFVTSGRSIRPAENDQVWGDQFKYANTAYEELRRSLQACQQRLSNMQEKLHQVNSEQYIENIRKKITHLKQLLNSFRNIKIDFQPGSLSRTSPGITLFQLNDNDVPSSPVRLRSAISITDTAVEDDHLINALIDKGEFFDAKNMYQGLVEASPNDSQLRLRFATFLLTMQGTENKREGIQQTEYVLQEDPHNTTALYLAAQLNIKLGELYTAKSLLERFMNIKCDDQDAIVLYQEVTERIAKNDANNNNRFS